MATTIPTDEELAKFTADDILKAWKEALLEGLGNGRTFAPEIVDLNGEIAKRLRGTIQAQLDERKSLTPPKSFDRAAFNASTRVARDTGLMCRIMADATTDKVVRKDVFQLIREVMALHPSCPAPGAVGTGPFC